MVQRTFLLHDVGNVLVPFLPLLHDMRVEAGVREGVVFVAFPSVLNETDVVLFRDDVFLT